MAVNVAINGFGRIGRLVLRGIIESGRKDVNVVAINDLGSVDANAHMLQYDSVHGQLPAKVRATKTGINVGLVKSIKVIASAIRQFAGNKWALILRWNAPACSPAKKMPASICPAA